MKVLLVSDLHANPFAFEILPEADAVLCMGDLVDYGPDPRGAIAWCRSRADAVVHGNHDRALAYDEDDGVAPAMREASRCTRAVHRALLDEGDVGYLRALPRLATVCIGTVTFALTHAFADDPCHYGPLADAAASARAAVPAAAVVAVGHTHVQDMLALEGAVAVNPGSLGMSSEGGRAHYAMWEDGRITLHSVPYDVAATLAALAEMPVPDDVRTVLRDAFQNGRRTNRGSA
jgi:predicted phosphodiesterase